MTSDFLLIQKIKNGDGSAAARLVEKYYTSIYQYCFLHIRDRFLAEDMAQETFVRFFESVMRYTDTGRTRRYLYCIAGNLIKNYHRKKKEIPVAADRLPEMTEDNLADLEIRLDMERALDQLPAELKEITILFFFQGLRQREIADLLGIKLSLVKYRVMKAKEKLALICERDDVRNNTVQERQYTEAAIQRNNIQEQEGKKIEGDETGEIISEKDQGL